MADRKRLFVAFFTLARNLPFTYVTFAHRKSEFDNDKRRFEAQLRRDLANYLLTHLDRFQSYDTIKIYYDNGQQVVTNALKASIGYALPRKRSSTAKPTLKTTASNKQPISCAPSN